jgi:hypothetical protein
MPSSDLQQATAAIAAVAAARPLSERVAQRSRNVERGRRATDRVVSTAVAANEPIDGSIETPITGEVAQAQPVRLVVNGAPRSTQVELDAPAQSTMGGTLVSNETARPWPRAVLPQLGGSGALAADYASAGPSFYPFTPRPTLEPAEAANDDGAPDTQQP